MRESRVRVMEERKILRKSVGAQKLRLMNTVA